MAKIENVERVHLQARGNYVDFWRIGDDNSLILHQSHPLASVDDIISDRADEARESLIETKINLGLSISTASLFLAEAAREKSKKLAVLSVIPIAGIIFSTKNLRKHKKEIAWLEKESVKWENDSKNITLIPQE